MAFTTEEVLRLVARSRFAMNDYTSELRSELNEPSKIETVNKLMYFSTPRPKRNEDEEASEKLYTLVQHVEVASVKGLQTEVVADV